MLVDILDLGINAKKLKNSVRIRYRPALNMHWHCCSSRRCDESMEKEVEASQRWSEAKEN